MNEEKPILYDLYAVSNHFGNMGFGHYTAYVKNKENWYQMDDRNVSKINENDVSGSQCYVLFYKR
jgi:ubiquitin carboxyl-terminal hydrolase 4/11/15